MSHFEKSFLASAEKRDLPPAIKLGTALGPGVILLATAMGSGEIFFWPGIAADYGFQFLWLTIAAILFQYVLNTEFLRYTTATGDAVVGGYCRLWPGFRWFFLAAAILPWVWPGWAMGGATAITWVFGGNAVYIGASSLVIIGLLLTTTKSAYKALELTQKLMVTFILVIAVAIAVLVVRGPSLSAAAEGLFTSPVPLPEGLNIAVLLAALAFCGAGGTINLATSNWARDKGLGLASYAPKVTSPFSGEKIALVSKPSIFTASEDNISRWNEWWRLVRMEQKVTFLGLGALGLIIFMLIAHSLIAGQQLGVGMSTVQAQADALGTRFGTSFSIAFSIGVAAIFLTSAVGVMDHAARLTASLISHRTTNQQGERISENMLYFIALWAMIIFGLIVLLGLDVSSPPVLLTIAGSLSGIVMFVYSALTIVLNRKMYQTFAIADEQFGERNPFKVSRLRLFLLMGSVALYGTLSLVVIYNTYNAIFG